MRVSDILCGAKVSTYFVPLLCVASVLLTACSKNEYRYEEGIVWNTSYHIIYEAEADYTDSLLSVMQQVDANLSPFNETSVVSHLNRTGSAKLSSMLADIIRVSGVVNSKTSGYFDPTAAPLINAYGFGAKKDTLPSEEKIGEMLKYVGFDKLLCSADSISFTDGRMQVNFSAIAKGYGCSKVAERLLALGVNNFMVEIGGEVVVRGNNPQGGAWRISIDRPLESVSEEIHASQLVVELHDGAIATSGNYRNFKESGGKRVGHIVDPVTGLPASTNVVSATVISDDCALSDAYATAFMAMPAAMIKELANKEKLGVFLIFRDGSTWSSSEFEKLISK